MLDSSLPPVFIVGCPRSGTTLMASLLRRTPWGGGFETHFIPKYHQRLRGNSDLSNRAKFRRTVAAILAERPIRQRGVRLNPDELYERLPRHDYASVADAICRSANRNGERSWADKTPTYVRHLPLIQELFPQSWIVYLVRDGRDVALSLMEKSWGPANVYAAARYWHECHRPQPIVDELMSRGQLIIVRYEDVLRSPQTSAERLLRFLNAGDEREIAKHWASRVKQTNSGKWKSRMSSAEAELFGRVAGNALRRFGYECDQQELPVGLLRRTAYQGQDRAKRWAHLLRMNTIEAVQIGLFGKQPFADGR
jgi:hypothetical protein